MPLTDLTFPLTAKQIGPMGAQVLTTPKVVYIKSSDIIKIEPDLRNGATRIKVNDVKKNITVYETPDEVLGMQALAQGATAAQVFTKSYGTLTPTASATASDHAVPSKYYNEISTSVAGANYLRLPDPFSRRLVVYQNLTTGSMTVLGRGATTPIISTGAPSTAGYVIGPLERVHFQAPTAATAGTTAPWYVAKDIGTV